VGRGGFIYPLNGVQIFRVKPRIYRRESTGGEKPGFLREYLVKVRRFGKHVRLRSVLWSECVSHNDKIYIICASIWRANISM